MIQRIQSIFLLLSSIAMALSVAFPLLYLKVDGQDITFESMGGYIDKICHYNTWSLFALGVLSSFLSLLVIFLYKKRILQIRIITINIFIMIGFYILGCFFIYRIESSFSIISRIGFGVTMPIISIILSYLAIRRIGMDEFLVKSLNRLRK